MALIISIALQISELVFDGEEKPWSANIKRGVLNMLQVNLKQHGRTDMNEETRLLNGVEAVQTPENDFFTCQEVRNIGTYDGSSLNIAFSAHA